MIFDRLVIHLNVFSAFLLAMFVEEIISYEQGN